MTWHKAYPNHPLTPEELTAYLDGELDADAQARVADKLHADAAARSEVEGQARLAHLWSAAPPPEPSEADWAATLAAIEARLPAGTERASKAGRKLGPWIIRIGMTAASVAACWLVFVLMKTPPEPPETPFAVASAGDVEILSMEDGDAGALVVGLPPVPGPLVLAAAGDIQVESVVPPKDGPVPRQLGMGDGPDAPMIWAPLSP